MRLSRSGLFLPVLGCAVFSGCSSPSSGAGTPGGGTVTVSSVSAPVEVKGEVALKGGAVQVSGGLVDVKGDVSVTNPVRVQGPVDVQGSVTLSAPLDINTDTKPLRVLTADTDPSRLVHAQVLLYYSSSDPTLQPKMLQQGPFVLTDLRLYPKPTGFSGRVSVYVSDSNTCAESGATTLEVLSFENSSSLKFADTTPLIGIRAPVPAGKYLCVGLSTSDTFASATFGYGGFRPYP